MWLLILFLIFSIDSFFILNYTKNNFLKTLEYILNFFFAIESPFVIPDLFIIFFSYILIFFNWSSLPIVIIQLYYKKKKEIQEFYDNIENSIIEREFRRLRKEKGKNNLNEMEIDNVFKISKIKIEKIKAILDSTDK